MLNANKPPSPIIDNLDHIGNPFFTRHFSASAHTDVADAGLDLEYSLKFLYSYNGSRATFNSYRRELERLLQWSWRVKKLSVIKLKREHIEEFIVFCSDPPDSWIGNKHCARYLAKNGERIPNTEWRPFVTNSKSKALACDSTGNKKNQHKHKKLPYAYSQSALRASFAIASSFYDYLLQEDLVEANPVAQIRQKSKFLKKQQFKTIVRRISNLQWDYVIETAEQMAQENPEEHERTLFIITCLLSMYLRISELVADDRSIPLMSDFRRDSDGNWWFHVTGKGNKERRIVVSDEMLQGLRRYREKFLNLAPLPAAGELTVLIPKLKGTGPVTSTRQIRRLVQLCFDRAFERMQAHGLQEDAAELRAATVHWLRHTGISEDVKIRPREHVRDDAGHASMATTDRYVESDLRERHQSGLKKPLRNL